MPVPVPGPPRRRSALPWVIGTAVLVVAATVGVILLVSSGGGGGGVANPKKITASANCEDILSEDDAAEVFGEAAKRDPIDDIEGCNFATQQDETEDPSFRVAVQSTNSGVKEETTFEGYQGYRNSRTGDCVLVIKVNDDPVYLLAQYAEHGQTSSLCEKADKAMRLVLGNIPNA